jgi:hypothetical protein
MIEDSSPQRRSSMKRHRGQKFLFHNKRDLTYSDSDDSSKQVSDSDINDELGDLGIDVDFEKEVEKAEVDVGEFLGKWRNAPDFVDPFVWRI